MDRITNNYWINWNPNPTLDQVANYKQPKEITMSTESKCPFSGDARKHTVAGAPSNADWWPNQLKLNILHQHSSRSDPMGE